MILYIPSRHIRESGGTAPFIFNFDTLSKCTVLFQYCLCSVQCVRKTYLVQAWIPQVVESSYSRRAHIVTRSFVEGPLTKSISLICRHVRSLLWLFTHSLAPSAITTTDPLQATSESGMRMRSGRTADHYAT